MQIVINIPKEFEEHFNSDKFKDSLERIRFDTQESIASTQCALSGNYEIETLDMLIKAFLNSTPLPKVIEDIKAEIESICENTTYPPDDTFFRPVVDEDYFFGLEYAIKIIDKHIGKE